MDAILAIGLFKVKQSQRQRKQARSRAGPAFDPAILEIFHTLGITPPDSAAEASTNIAIVISEQLDILKVLVFHTFWNPILISFQFYLEILRDSEVEDFIRKRYIPIESLGEDVVDSAGEVEPFPVEDVNIQLKTPAAFPMVQPMKACVTLLRTVADS
jgi:hypothetical protein